MSYQFQTGLPKGFSQESGRGPQSRGCPPRRPAEACCRLGPRQWCQVGPPTEKYCLTGVAWGLKDGWESEGKEYVELPGRGQSWRCGGVVTGVSQESPPRRWDFEPMEDVFGDALGDRGGGGDVE